MKVIDLLNIDELQRPEKIKYKGSYYYLNVLDKKQYYTKKQGMGGISLTFDFSNLNEEVEIIEEEKKIEKINILVDDTNMEYVANNKGKKLSYSKSDLLFANKINELIEEIEKLKGKSE